MARFLRYFGLVALLLVLIGGGVYAGLVHYAGAVGSTAGSEGDQKGLLATAIEKALSTPGANISIGAVDGPLSSDAVIRDVVISDERGPWLKLDRARIVWTRSALLLGQLLVGNLEIGHLEVLRRPIPAPAPEAAPEQKPAASSGPLSAPSLPIKVKIDAFSLARLDLGEDLIGVAAQLGAQGHASLGRPSDGLDLVFDLKRQDAPGALGLKLAFDPKSTVLKLGAAVHEPAGGLIAHAAGLAGLPPVDFDLNGDGPLDAFQSRLNFVAGPLATVSGGARLDRRDAARALTLELDGAIEKLLPPWLGPVFLGHTKVAGALLFGDDGSYGLDQFQIAAKEAQLDASGRLAADQTLDGHVRLNARNDSGRIARAGVVEIGALDFQLDAAGPMLAPKLDARLHIADAAAPPGRIGRLDLTATARPDGPATDPATRADVAVDAAGDGLSFSDKALSDAIGGKLALTLRARAAPSGDADVSVGKLSTGAGDVEATGAFGLNRLKGRVDFSAPDLARFAALAGQALAGSLKGGADLSGAPSEGRIDANLAISAEKLATGTPAADALIGGKAEIAGALGKSSDGFHFEALTLTTPNLSARLDGQATRAAADVTFAAQADDLARISKDLAGKAQAQGRLTGSLAHPDAALTLSLADVRSMGRSIPRLNFDITAKDLIAAPAAQIALDGLVAGKPAKGQANVARDAAGAWTFASQNLSLGSVALSGSGALSAARLIDGAFTLAAGDLDDLSPLALQKLAGRLDGKFSFSSADGKQGGAVQLKASGLRAAQASIDRLDLDAKASDLFGAPRIDGTAALDRAVVGGESVPRLRFTAKSAGDGSDFTLSTEARGVQLESRGRLIAATPIRIDLAAFEARGAGQRITLGGPARLTFPDGGVEIRGLALTSGAGRLTVDGSAGKTLDLTIAAKALPLSLARLAAPDLALDGALDASARISGMASAPSGDWRIDLPRLSAPQLRTAGIDSIGIRASGRLDGGRTSLKAAMTLPRGGTAQIDGFVPLDPAGALDLTIRAALDAAIANVALASGGQTVAGRLTIDARAQGSPQKPQLSGAANLTGGSFEDPLAGVRFDRIVATLRAQGDQITVERFTAATRNGGSVSVSGNVRVAPDAGFPASLRIAGQNAELVSNDYVTAVANLALDLSGPLARRPRIDGKVSFDSIDVRVPDRIPASSLPLENTRHVAPTPAARARLALKAKRAGRSSRKPAPPAFNADLSVAISAPSRIFVRGHGIDAELGGDLTVTGDLAAPATHGAFQLRRGAFTLAGKRLDFSRGNITFTGGVIPQLDFSAQTSAGDVTAQIAITGPADQPEFAFSSTPELPQDEVMSRLLFNSASGGLSAIQALQLAQTVAEFSGQGGPGVLERMRRSLGVDTLDVQVGADGSPRVGSSRYISRNVNVGVRTGAKPSDNAATLGVDITKRLRVQGEAAANGGTAMGVSTQWEY
jgi:translocation and assembly module TamB